MKIKNEKEIFDLFVDDEDSMRDVLKTPFIPEHDGRVWASDSYIPEELEADKGKDIATSGQPLRVLRSGKPHIPL